jgi:DNA invertase Pin-like site-specific DNA recombinase
MTEPKVSVALYARVSTSDQDPGLQLLEMRAYVDRRGWVLAGEFVDHGVSGSKDRRPALDQLMAGARRREFDAVVCWRFDRFARSVKHLVLALDEFQSLGVAFVSLREALDFSTPMGRAMFTVIAAMSELERELIRERVRAGIAKAKAAGKRLGRPATPLDLNTAATRLQNGESLRAVAGTMNIHHTTLGRALARRAAAQPSLSTPCAGSP